MKTHYLVLIFFMLFNTLSIAQTGPGGVGNAASVVMWLSGDFGVFTDAGTTRATHGQQVMQWNDRSGNNRHATQGTLANRPLFHLNSANGAPGLRFTGNMFIDGPALGISSTSDYTYFICFRDTTTVLGGTHDGDGHYILDRVGATNELVSLKPVTGSRYFFQKRNNAGGGLGGVTGTTPINTNTKIIQMRRDYNVNYVMFYNNVQEGGTLADPDGPKTPPRPRLGRHATIDGNGIRGFINEFIIFNFALLRAQRIIVQNYLAAKYGIALGGLDIYTMDNPANGNFDHDVAGIGRIAPGNLHTDAQGTGIVRILNPGDLEDDEFLFWGHNNGALRATNTTDVPATVQARLDRVWRVSEVNTSGAGRDVGNVDMRFDLNGLGTIVASQLRLLIDVDDDGIFSDNTPIAVSAIPLGGGIYVFENVPGGSLSNNRRFTLGTTNVAQTPLPIELLSFEALARPDRVVLRWATASETNNDFFTIERSLDAKNWNVLTHVDGAGNSTETLRYSIYDHNPYKGISYYRLKQTDYDGAYSYSHISAVRFEGPEIGIAIFPNPANKVLNIATSETSFRIQITNTFGQVVMTGYSQFELDISQLIAGVYFVRIVFADGTTHVSRLMVSR